eukprot:2342831-Alexandrium_andersonii.AAC.1
MGAVDRAASRLRAERGEDMAQTGPLPERRRAVPGGERTWEVLRLALAVACALSRDSPWRPRAPP